MPGAELSPREVVAAQLEALRRNDDPYPDCGIETAYRFASPANRAATGPIERFARMLRDPMYQPMLNCRRVELGLGLATGDLAWVEAAVVDAEGETVVYEFTLSRVKELGCWMTDSVLRR